MHGQPSTLARHRSATDHRDSKAWRITHTQRQVASGALGTHTDVWKPSQDSITLCLSEYSSRESPTHSAVACWEPSF